MYKLYRKSRTYVVVTLVFTADDVKNDANLFKLDVNVNNRTAVAGSAGFLKLE